MWYTTPTLFNHTYWTTLPTKYTTSFSLDPEHRVGKPELEYRLGHERSRMSVHDTSRLIWKGHLPRSREDTYKKGRRTSRSFSLQETPVTRPRLVHSDEITNNLQGRPRHVDSRRLPPWALREEGTKVGPDSRGPLTLDSQVRREGSFPIYLITSSTSALGYRTSSAHLPST